MPVQDVLKVDVTGFLPELGVRDDLFIATISGPVFPAAAVDARLGGVSGSHTPWQGASYMTAVSWVPFPTSPMTLELDFARNSIQQGEVSFSFFDHECELENPEEEKLK
jgi:hypothetical protein